MGAQVFSGTQSSGAMIPGRGPQPNPLGRSAIDDQETEDTLALSIEEDSPIQEEVDLLHEGPKVVDRREDTCSASRYGNIWRFAFCGGCHATVGPHWPYSLFMLAMISGIGAGFTIYVTPVLGSPHRLLGTIVTVSSLLSF